ncbi:hypothetical protein K523DRAFT_366906 [Schizophyllum commune Tattone D]|nr:hypothetical protein K523DRAFT_366906 [Schizophyllum commune Tattone D]
MNRSSYISVPRTRPTSTRSGRATSRRHGCPTSLRSEGTTSTRSSSSVSAPRTATSVPQKHTLVQSPPRKLRKTMGARIASTTIPKARNQTGALYALPLDLLFEIFAHLDLTSLFHLTRTSHALRHTLLSPAATRIWLKSPRHSSPPQTRTRAKVCVPKTTGDDVLGVLPPLIRDLSIREFFDLVFDNVCDFCRAAFGEEDGVVRIWAARLRCCEGCLNDSTHIALEKDMPTQFHMVRDVQRYFGKDYFLSNLFPASVGDLFGPSRPYPRVAVERVIADFERDNHGKSEEDRKAWILRRAAEHHAVVEHANTCVRWTMARQRRQETWLRAMRKERVEQINNRLKGLDAVPPSVFETMTELAETPAQKREYSIEGFDISAGICALVRAPEPLSEDDGARFRKRYASFERARVQFTQDKQNKGCLVPGIGDLATWKEVTDVIEDTPIEEEVFTEDLRALIDNLARTQRFSGWRAACEDALVAILNPADPVRERPATTADLALAATVFMRAWVPVCVWYPAVLEWTPKNPFVEASAGTEDSSGREDPPRVVTERAWSADESCVDVRRSRLAARTVAMAGLDPATATVEDTDALGVWFARMKGAPDGRKERRVMQWRDTIKSLSLTEDEGDELVIMSDQEVEEESTRRHLEILKAYQEGLQSLQSCFASSGSQTEAS